MADKKEEIINAALELIAEHGFHGAPMAMVAERAGVAAGTIYRYFESKDVLIQEIFAFVEQQILASIQEKYPEEQSVRERFLHMGRTLIGYFLAFPLEFRFIEQFHNSPYGIAHRRDKLLGNREKDLVTKIFAEGQEQQIVKELPLPILCALTFGPLVDACRDHILQFIVLDDLLVTQIVEACWDAVKL